MLVFISSFIVFTITNTFFHNIKISILSFILSFIILVLFVFFVYKKHIRKYLKYVLILIGSFVLSLSALVIKDWRYNEEFMKSFLEITKIPAANFVNNAGMTNDFSLPTFTINPDLSYYIGTGKIVDSNSYGKYIFQNFSGEEYILNTDNNYQIGDKLRLVGYVKETNLLSSNITLSGLSNFSGWNFDYDRRLIMKGYNGNIYEQNSINFPYQESPGFIQSIKKSLQSKIISTYGEGRNAGLILGMLIGDKSKIPKPDYQKFIDSGLVHLIAVSGGNIIMLVIFLSFVLFFLPFYIRNFIILLSIILYSFVCGMDSSVVRAVLFGGLGIMALFVGREVNFRRSVYIVFILMLLINPYFLLYDLGFLLSFGAIIGIKIFNEKKLDSGCKTTRPEGLRGVVSKTCLPVGKVYNSYLKPSIGANIGIFPIIIFFMGKINLVGFITNLFVLPLVPFVMIYGFISIFLYSLFPRKGWVYIQELLINYIYKISEIGSNYGIYLLVNDYIIKYLILILFVIGLIIYMIKNKIIYVQNINRQNKTKHTIKHNINKSK